MSHFQRNAFSRVDVVFLIGVVMLSLGLALPALRAADERAKRLADQNNLKLIVVACHNYHDKEGHFPAGIDSGGFSAATYLLPYLEEDKLFKELDLNKRFGEKPNSTAAKAEVKFLLSPLDPRKNVSDKLAATNYLFSAGTKIGLADNDGLFYQGSQLRIADVADGTSNTICVGETLKGDGSVRATDVARQHVLLDETAVQNGVKDDVGLTEWKASKNIVGDRCASWMDGRFLQATYTATLLPNDARPDVSFEGLGGYSALRSMDDTITVGFCDGSVRRMQTKKLKLETWKALATRAGGEIIDFSSF